MIDTVNLSRRAFVWGAGAAAAAMMTSSAAPMNANAAFAPPATIGLGFSLYGMKSLAVDKALELCAEIGYDCVELAVQAGWPTDSALLTDADRAKIRAKLEATKLRLASLMENLHADVDDPRHQSNLQRLEAAGKLGHELSPERPPVIETVLGGSPARWEESKQRMAERLRDWAKVAESTETVVAIKAHVGGAMHRPEHPVWLCEQVGSPWIRCAYDYSHFELRGIDMAASVQTLAPFSRFIHVKDSAGDDSRVTFLLPGEGEIDYVRLLKLIAAAGYAGDIVVEVSGQIHGKPDYDPIAAARKCYENLAPAFASAGVQRG